MQGRQNPADSHSGLPLEFPSSRQGKKGGEIRSPRENLLSKQSPLSQIPAGTLPKCTFFTVRRFSALPLSRQEDLLNSKTFWSLFPRNVWKGNNQSPEPEQESLPWIIHPLPTPINSQEFQRAGGRTGPRERLWQSFTAMNNAKQDFILFYFIFFFLNL